MGRRKSKAKVQKKVVLKVDTVFDCPFCNHAKTVECKIDGKINLGEIKCRVCDASFQTQTNFLSQPIDVYSEWIDACEEANAPSNLAASSAHAALHSREQKKVERSVDLSREDLDDEDAKYAAENPETAEDRAFVVDDVGVADSDDDFGGSSLQPRADDFLSEDDDN